MCIYVFDFWVEQTVEKSLREETSHTVDGSEIPNNHLGYIKPMERMGSTDKLPNYQLLPTSTGFLAGFLVAINSHGDMATWQGIQSLNSKFRMCGWAVAVAEKSPFETFP